MRALAATALVALFGCAKSTPEPARDVAPQPAATTDDRPQANAASLVPITSVEDKLAYEATTRPPAARVRSDDALASLERAGLVLTDKQQHVASIFGARYCVGARAQHGLAVSVCEYDGEVAAQRGRDESKRALAVVANRDVYANGALTLTVRQTARDAASEALAKKATAAFAKL